MCWHSRGALGPSLHARMQNSLYAMKFCAGALRQLPTHIRFINRSLRASALRVKARAGAHRSVTARPWICAGGVGVAVRCRAEMALNRSLDGKYSPSTHASAYSPHTHSKTPALRSGYLSMPISFLPLTLKTPQMPTHRSHPPHAGPTPRPRRPQGC